MSKKKGALDFSMVLASSVHDMKNSIGMLVASLEEVIYEAPAENPRQKKRFNTLHYEASRINSELVQLLTIYRMEHEFLPVRIDQHYLIDVLEDQVARNDMLVESGDIGLKVLCADDLNWYCDGDLIGSVIHNVLVNCIRYTKSQIILSAQVVDDTLCISIEDNGSGYPEHMLRKPAGMVEVPDLDSDGTHLGLYFAEKIAAMHTQKNRHGYIRLENGGSLGGGIFKLVIP